MSLKVPLLLLIGTAMTGWATTSFVTFNQTAVTVNVGDTFDLTAVLGTDAQVGSYVLDLVFPTFLQVLSDPAEQGFFLANGLGLDFTIDNAGGAVTGVNDAAIFGTDTGIDALFTIDFTAVATGSDILTFQNVSLSDGDGNAIPVDSVGVADVASVTPEPATWTLAALGAAMLFAGNRARRRGKTAND